MAVGLVLAASGLALASPVAGACGLTPEAVNGAPVAFVGTLSAVTPDGLTGTFHIEDVWRGPALQVGADIEVDVADGGVPATVQMPPDGTMLRFLVLASTTSAGRLVTQRSCAIFAYPWSDSYAAFRPASAPQLPDASSGTDLSLPFIAVAAIAAVVGIAGLVAFRRRSATSSE